MSDEKYEDKIATDEASQAWIDQTLADSIIKRLNELCEAPGVRVALKDLIEVRVDVSAEVANHPTLQVTAKSDGTDTSQLGFLGALNGLVGVLPDGPRKDWGYITAVFDDETQELLRFERTKNVAQGIISP